MLVDVSTGLPGSVRTCDSVQGVAQEAAKWIAELSNRVVESTGVFSIALSGGNTPRALYELLATEPHRSTISWNCWQVFFGDERACPPDDSNSNYHLAAMSLLSHVPIPTDHIHRMPADAADLNAAARAYSDLLDQQLAHNHNGIPMLNCVLLGIGNDGHTASLFPDTPALAVIDSWTTRGVAPSPPHDRLTLTYPIINAAGNVAFLAVGAEKISALQKVRQGTVPAAKVMPTSKQLTWFIDRIAAQGLTQNTNVITTG